MRVLVGFAGGSGHAEPLLPIARAALDAGHDVRIACEPWMAERTRQRGFATLAIGNTNPAVAGTTIAPLVEFDQRAEDAALRDHFATTLANQRSDGVRHLLRTWRADVVLCDEVDLGAAVAAEAADIALVRVVVIAAGGFLLPEVIAPALDVVRAHHGLEPDPQLERLHSRLLISPVPPGFRDPHDPLPDAALSIRPGPDTVNGDATPAWMDGLDPARPTVYATLGTIFNMESGDLFPRVLAALQGITANTVLSVGPQLDPRQFAPHRGVRVERWVPHEHLLPRCDVAVTHAGSGSVVAALTHGVPLVLLPMGADQRNNARRCEVLGVGVTLDPLRCAPADVRAAVERLLTDTSFRDRANAVKAAVDALPGPRSAVAFLQDLASV